MVKVQILDPDKRVSGWDALMSVTKWVQPPTITSSIELVEVYPIEQAFTPPDAKSLGIGIEARVVALTTPHSLASAELCPMLAKLWIEGSRCSEGRCPGGLPLADSVGADDAPIGALKVALKKGIVEGVTENGLREFMVPGPAVKVKEAIEAGTCATGTREEVTVDGSTVYHQSRSDDPE
jgi:hypothetical protein